jgi:hypothetical protein
VAAEVDLGGAEVRPVRAAAHNDADEGAGRLQAAKMKRISFGEKSLGTGQTVDRID